MIAGAYYPDNLNGLSFIFEDYAFSVNCGYLEDGVIKGSYYDILPTLKSHLSSPDGKINILSWKTGSAEISMTSVNINNVIWGSIAVKGTAEIVFRSFPCWRQLAAADYAAAKNCITAKYGGSKFTFTVSSNCIPQKDGIDAYLHCILTNSAAEFIAGIAPENDFAYYRSKAQKVIDDYDSTRCRASGVFGDFLSPIMREANLSQIYHPVQRFIGYTVVRAWCVPDQVRFFCWDNFFTALLLSIEDREAAERAADSIFYCAGADGHIPNVGIETGCVSEWSQPPVWSMAVYKMYQRLNNKDYLEKVYGKLRGAHEWWFAVNPGTHLPNRDSNGDGLLQWGGGSRQDAKFESGMDDSPMYDEIEMDEASGCMKLDDVGLTSLWAMDCYYLALIADVLDKKEDAAYFSRQFEVIKRRINELLWNEELGIYCNRYHCPQIESFDSEGEIIPSGNLLSGELAPGLTAKFFEGSQFEVSAYTCVMPTLDITAESLPVKNLSGDTFSAVYSGYLKPSEDGYYALLLDGGIACGYRFYLNDELLVDEKMLGIRALYRIPARLFKASEKYKIKVELTKNIKVSDFVQLKWYNVNNKKASVFSRRLSPTNFYPLITGIADRQKFERMMKVYKTRFNSPYVIPTTTADDPAYPDQNYWRGKVWAPTNYLFWLGLKRYADEKTLKDFAYHSLELFMKNYNETGGCHENYCSSGEGASERHYVWGALLCLIGLEYFCDISDSGEALKRCCGDAEIELKNINSNGAKYSDQRGSTNQEG